MQTANQARGPLARVGADQPNLALDDLFTPVIRLSPLSLNFPQLDHHPQSVTVTLQNLVFHCNDFMSFGKNSESTWTMRQKIWPEDPSVYDIPG